MKSYLIILLFLVINIYPQIPEITDIDFIDLLSEFDIETTLED